MSNDGTTCCGTAPVGTVRTTWYVVGSITETLADIEFGTYTSGLARAAIGDNAFAPAAAHVDRAGAVGDFARR